MSCSASNSTTSGSSDGVDLYRDSFKYFKSYCASASSVLSSLPRQLTPECKRKNERKSRKAFEPNEGGDYNANLAENGCNNGNMNVNDGDEQILLRHPGDDESVLRRSILKREVSFEGNCSCYKMWGLRLPETWNVVELTFPAGLIVIKNPFTPAGQRYWISRALLDFPHHPQYITNMDNLNRLEKIKKGEPVENLEKFKMHTCGRDFYEKLRWQTYGYHHDWDTKVYTEERRSTFPEDLADMTRYISQILGFKDFEAEAAIANYYHMDSTLSGHVDRSEVNQFAPLFSLSFGQAAIFLIGGKTKMERPQPVLLQSGDIAVMSGESRLSYHGVPKILLATKNSWQDETASSNQTNDPVPSTISYKRPKLDGNVNNNNSDSYQEVPSSSNCAHDCVSFNASLKDSEVSHRMENIVWTDFLNNYIRKSRINLNIRQVLFPGQSDLYSSVTKS